MGGSSLAPEDICEAMGVELTVVDSSDPDFVRDAIEDRLAEAVVVVSSKSGGTVETDSQRRAFEKAFTDAGIDPAERFVVVTDPGSPLEKSAREAGYRVFTADPDVGGRYSALTAFGLVPSGLAGADLDVLLDEAQAMHDVLVTDSLDNPALRLGALLGAANRAGVDKLVLANAGAQFEHFGDWAEQLIAESTGKDGKGILPVVVDSTGSPNFVPSSPDEVLGTYGPDFVFDSVRPASALGRHRRGHSGRPAAAVGVRHRRRRAGDRHQPVRPARRRERQVRGPRHARGRRRHPVAGLRRRPGHRLRLRGLAARRHRHGRRRRRGAARPPRPRPRLRRGPGLPPPSSRRGARRRTRHAGLAHGPPGDVRLGSALPALDRAVPQGRTRRRASTSR